MQKILKNNKGISLTLITGFVSLLMVIAAGISELIIANMRSIQRIEASNKAYYAAEAGLEDALYELSQHMPGYETPSLEDKTNVRKTVYGNDWYNEWEIKSLAGTTEWENKMYKNDKLMIYLYNDTQSSKIDLNSINTNTAAIKKIFDNGTGYDFSITFFIPDGVIQSGELAIDNDGDLGLSSVANGLNEDKPNDSGTCKTNPEDSDCDGLVDEDTKEDPVIIWKLTDGSGRTLIPIKGCLEETGAEGSGNEKSEICEKDFNNNPLSKYSVTLNQTHSGIDQNGEKKTIRQFIIESGINSQLHFEFLIVAPMEHVQMPGIRYDIPYIGYRVNSVITNIPKPYYTIRTDGYYRGFKQSVTAYLTPKTTVPLFDFTIIQHQ